MVYLKLIWIIYYYMFWNYNNEINIYVMKKIWFLRFGWTFFTLHFNNNFELQLVFDFRFLFKKKFLFNTLFNKKKNTNQIMCLQKCGYSKNYIETYLVIA